MAIVTVTADLNQRLGPLHRIWRSFGYDEMNWTYTPTGKSIFRQIKELGDGPFWIRNHNAFTTGNRLSWDYWASTNCYTEDERHRPTYDFSENDRVYDVYVEAGCKPMIELDFMPHDLSSQKDLGPAESWRYPPRDYDRWMELNARFAEHLISRYGKREVRSWYFSPWNEPDISYFKLDPAIDPGRETEEQLDARCAEYCKLYDYAVAGLLQADEQLCIGGPDLANRTDFLERFLRHCHSGTNYVTGKTGSRLDFISLHSKATGCDGIQGRKFARVGSVPNPDFDRTARRDVLRYYEVIREFPEFRQLPLIGNEWDIDVGTPWGLYDSPDFAYRNGSYFPVYVIRSVKELLDLRSENDINVELITQWTFYFEGKRCFEGTRSIFDPMGVRKALFNGFEMLARLGEERIGVSSDDIEDDVARGETAGQGNRAKRPANDEEAARPAKWNTMEPHKTVDGLASRNDDAFQVLVWHQRADQYASGERDVELVIRGMDGWEGVSLTHYRIDAEHSNAATVWQRMGRPDYPTAAQLQAMKEREGLEALFEDCAYAVEDGRLELRFSLPVHGVSMLVGRRIR